MTFDKGTLILINYTAKIKEGDKVFETTLEEEAKKHLIHKPDMTYQPKLVSVGESWVLRGLDEALAGTSSGDSLSVEVSPDKGFGERDLGKVRTVPLRKLGDDADKVSVGDSIMLDRKKGVIRLIGSGRVQIDFNHAYAGKTLVYDVSVLRSIDSDRDKIQEILKKHFSDEGIQPQFQDGGSGNLEVEIPDGLFRHDGLAAIKYFAQLELFKFVPSLQTIRFAETYQNKSGRPAPSSGQASTTTTTTTAATAGSGVASPQ